MQTLYPFPPKLNTSLEEINLNQVPLLEIQKQRFNEVLQIPDITIIEVATSEKNEKADHVSLYVTFKDKQNLFYYCTISFFRFFVQKPFRPFESSTSTIYHPLTLEFEEQLLYRHPILHEQLLNEQQTADELVKEVETFLTSDISYKFDQADSLLEKWNSVNNHIRVYVFAHTDKTCLKKEQRFCDELGLKFYLPFHLNGEQYGYQAEVLLPLRSMSESRFMIYPSLPYKGTPLLQREDLDEWRRPILSFLKELQQVEGFHLTGMYQDYIPPYGDHTIKILGTHLEISLDEISFVVKQINTILEPIMTL